MQGASGRLAGIASQGGQPFQHPRSAAVQCGGGGELRRSRSGSGQGLCRLLDEPAPFGGGQDRAGEIKQAVDPVRRSKR